MNDQREQRIRERAHQIWEREGRPDGQEQSHWERASREIDEEDRKGEKPSRDRSFEGAGTERASGEPRSGASFSRIGVHDPRNVADDLSDGKSRA